MDLEKLIWIQREVYGLGRINYFDFGLKTTIINLEI